MLWVYETNYFLFADEKVNDNATVAYVTYALPEDAASAVQTLENHQIEDNKLVVKFAKSRTEQQRLRPRAPAFDAKNYRDTQLELPREKPPRQKTIKKKARLIIRNLSFQVNYYSMIVKNGLVIRA